MCDSFTFVHSNPNSGVNSGEKQEMDKGPSYLESCSPSFLMNLSKGITVSIQELVCWLSEA